MKLVTLDNLNHFKEKLNATNFNLIYPVGVTYTQYPQQASPNELWGSFSTWEVVDYDGAFFRAAGGNANDFIEKSGVLSKQEDQNKAHSHFFTPAGTVSSNFTGTKEIGTFGGLRSNSGGRTEATGVFSWGSKHDWIGRRNENYGDMFGVDFSMTPKGSVSSSFSGIRQETESSGSDESRPQNYTVRVWKRVA